MTKEQLAEESTIDIAYAVLAERGEHLTLRQLMDEVRKLNGVTVRAMAENLPRINTNINIDGRFLSIDDIRWGLREWYPVDQLEVETAPVVRARRKKKRSTEDDEDDEDLIVDEDGFDVIDLEEDDEDEEDTSIEVIEAIDVEVDEDLLDEDEEDVIPDDVVFDDEDDEDDEDLDDEEDVE